MPTITKHPTVLRVADFPEHPTAAACRLAGQAVDVLSAT